MTFTAIQGIMMLVLVLIRPPNSMSVMPFEAAAKEVALMIVDVGLGWIFKQMESTCDSFSLIDLHSLHNTRNFPHFQILETIQKIAGRDPCLGMGLDPGHHVRIRVLNLFRAARSHLSIKRLDEIKESFLVHIFHIVHLRFLLWWYARIPRNRTLHPR